MELAISRNGTFATNERKYEGATVGHSGGKPSELFRHLRQVGPPRWCRAVGGGDLSHAVRVARDRNTRTGGASWVW